MKTCTHSYTHRRGQNGNKDCSDMLSLNSLMCPMLQ